MLATLCKFLEDKSLSFPSCSKSKNKVLLYFKESLFCGTDSHLNATLNSSKRYTITTTSSHLSTVTNSFYPPNLHLLILHFHSTHAPNWSVFKTRAIIVRHKFLFFVVPCVCLLWYLSKSLFCETYTIRRLYLYFFVLIAFKMS